MSVAKKNSTRKTAGKADPEVVVVTKTFVPAKEYIFPEKLKKAKEILTEAKFRPA
jgi:hypothetical protein